MSSTHRVLIVGAGSIGERHLRCFSGTGRAAISLCEINLALRARVADQYGVTKLFDNIESALSANPSVVVVATPAPLHIPMATAAVDAGAHVLIEKPLSTTLEGLEALRERARVAKVTLGVAYVYRCHPVLAAMRAALQAGRFGKPVEIIATCGQHFPLYRPAFRETYYRDRATGGGAVQDALTHIINAGEWLVGPVDRLVADVDRLVLEGVNVEDTAHVLTRQGCVMGTYSLNQHQAPNEITITVVGTHGTARFENHRSHWLSVIEPGNEWQVEAETPLERDTIFTRQANVFLDAVESGTPPPCDLEEAWQTLRVNLAILSSAENSRWEVIREKPSVENGG